MFDTQQAQVAQDRERRAAQENAVRTALMEQIRQAQQPVDPNQVATSPEARGFARIQDRARERLRAQAAERTGVAGTGGVQTGEIGGALGAAVQTGESEAAENIAGLQSQLYARELQSKRQQLMQTLQLGAGLLTTEQQQDIQQQLAVMDNAIQQSLGTGQLGLGQSELALRGALGAGQFGLGASELGLRGELGRGQLGLGQGELALRGELGRGQLGLGREELGLRGELGRGQLGLGGRELDLRRELGIGQLDLGYDTLGAETGYRQALLNRDALLGLLRGGG